MFRVSPVCVWDVFRLGRGGGGSNCRACLTLNQERHAKEASMTPFILQICVLLTLAYWGRGSSLFLLLVRTHVRARSRDFRTD